MRAHRAYILRLSNIPYCDINSNPGFMGAPPPWVRGIYIRESGSAHGIWDVQQYFFFL